MNKNRPTLIMDIILLVISAVFCVGTKALFHACGPKEDGGWMTCHWAEQAVFAVSIAILAMAVIRLILRDRKAKTGVSLAMIPAAVMAAVIPNNMIKLCMMTDMRCHSVMRPAVIICAAVIVIAAAVSIFVGGKEPEEKQ